VSVVLTGNDLARDDMVRVARRGETVHLDETALARMRAAREVVDERLAAGDSIYGGTTALGVLKRASVNLAEAGAFSGRVIGQHRIAQGDAAPPDVVRATMLRLANGFAAGHPGVRPALAERLVDALNSGRTPLVRILGSVGQSDLGPMADLAAGLFEGEPLEAGEGLALVSSNAFSTASAALAVADAAALIDTMELSGACSLEALGANPNLLHVAIGDARPYPGVRESLSNLRSLLAGSSILMAERARSLQDPLSFRTMPQVLGACRDALTHVDGQLAIELNASQGNPIVVMAERRVVSVANFEILPIAAALDYLRIVLASALGSAAERCVKLLETPWSGLPTGLTPSGDPADPGLSYLGIAAQSIAAEARLLAAPVSFELVSTAHAEGIEDRTSLAPLAARRLAEMTSLGARVVAIELTVATQATELRGTTPCGAGTSWASSVVRESVPFLAAGGLVPDVEPLATAVRLGELSRPPA
jgi:histidine ammonia-lyase